MAYELDLHRPASQSIRRAYRQALAGTASVLAGDDPDRVHDARTSVKRARALLRIVRHDVSRSLFEEENEALREAGRALSAVRDAVVLVEALDGLLARGSEEDRAALAPLRARLQARRDALTERGGDHLAEAARALGRARAGAAAVAPAHRGWRALARGLDRAYRRVHDREARAFAGGRDEDFHALRKAVKDLTYQDRFLRPIDEPRLRAEGVQLAKLGDLLGDDHDLAVLRSIEGQPGADADPAAVARLEALATARQAELRSAAHPLLQSLLAEPPRRRLARLEAAFRAARDQAERCRGKGHLLHFA